MDAVRRSLAPPSSPSFSQAPREINQVDTFDPPEQHSPSAGRLLQVARANSNIRAGTEGKAPSASSETLTRVGGVINSRSSVHRPPNSAKGVYTGAGQGSIQHDLELLAVYKQLGREEDRALASYTSPYLFEDDAVDVTVKVDSHLLNGLVLNLEGFDHWVHSMHAAVEQRSHRAAGRRE